MKEPIEKIVKKSLEQHEMPYNAAAWTSMQAKLDAKATPPPSSNWKYFSAAGIVLIAASSYFFFRGDNKVTSQQQANALTEEVINSSEKKTTSETDNELSAENTAPHSSTVKTTEKDYEWDDNQIIDETVVSSGSTPVEEPLMIITDHSEIATEIKETSSSEERSSGSTSTRPVASTKSITFPSIDNMCLGQSTLLKNENEVSLIVRKPDGQEFEIQANSSDNFRSSQSGRHLVGYYDETNFVEASSFMINEVPKADFSIDLDNKFENGLPTTHVEATTHGESYMWNAEGRIVHGEHADLHFYKEGLHKVVLEVSNGDCKNRVEKQIKVDRYNLMANTGLNPKSLDPRNSTFMPFALTEREDTKFRMIIIDSRDGGVVYETTDSSLPWDGTDKRTGKIESSLTTYIWKVVLENPELGEPAEYKGTITKL